MKVFKEKQHFTQWWVWLILLSIFMLFLYGTIQQVFLKISFGDNPMSNAGIILTTSLFLIFLIVFKLLTLKTKINEQGVFYKFFPINKNYKLVEWKNINSIRVIKYRPLQDYGGWGIKHGSYTVKGNLGIQVEFKGGNKILIGTQKKEEVNRVLATYKNKIQ